MAAGRWAWAAVAGILAAVVGWSLFNQVHRPATLGQRVVAALAKSPMSSTLERAPVLIEYGPAARTGVILLEGREQALAFGRDVRRVELTGDVRLVGSFAAAEEGAIRVVAPGRNVDVSRAVERLGIEAGPGAWTLAIDAPRYHLARQSGGGAILALADAPLPVELQTLLTTSLASGLSWRVSAAEVIARQRAALRAQSEFDLFQEFLAADPSMLERADDGDIVCRRALAMLLFARPAVALRWPEDAAYALTDAERLSTGESRVRVYGFDPVERNALTWRAVVTSQPEVSPEELRRVIDGLVPRRH